MRSEQSETHQGGRHGGTNDAIDQGDSFERVQKKSNKKGDRPPACRTCARGTVRRPGYEPFGVFMGEFL